MSEQGRRAERVGVRELRQNLSVYLRRIEHGETFEVTDRGRSVARLAPVEPVPMGKLDELVTAGRAVQASRPFSAVRPIVTLPPGAPALSAVLAALRDDEPF